MIYFDNAASWPVLPSVREALTEALAEDYANPAAAHAMGKKLSERIENMRNDFLKHVCAPSSYQFYFTGSATESNNWAVWQLKLTEENEVFFSRADHPSLIAPLENSGARLRSIPRLKNGKIDLEKMLSELSSKTTAVFLTWVNGQSGHIEDVTSMGHVIKSKFPQVYIHVDGVQGFAKHTLSFKNSSIDSFSISSHKIGGPKGMAGIYFRQPPARSLLIGGGQESNMRAGTLAYPLIMGMHQAMKEMEKNGEKYLSKIRELNQHLRSLLAKNKEIQFCFSELDCSVYILMLTVKGIPSDVILRHLEMEEIYCSSTAACSSKIKGINPVFTELGLPQELHKNVLRISLGVQNTTEEVERLGQMMSKTIQTISRLSSTR